MPLFAASGNDPLIVYPFLLAIVLFLFWLATREGFVFVLLCTGLGVGAIHYRKTHPRGKPAFVIDADGFKHPTPESK